MQTKVQKQKGDQWLPRAGDGRREGWTRKGFNCKEDIQMVIIMHIKRCSISLITREMQIKTTMRYHFIPIRITIIKNKTKQNPENNKCW